MTRFLIADLYFTYRDDRPRLCHELHGLADDEIEVLLEALKHRFDKSEPDAFTFTIKTSGNYSPLELVKRQRGGIWADSGINGEAEQLAISLNIENRPELTDDQRRWLDVRNIALAMSGEINQLRAKLSHGPIKSSVLAIISREELLAHLDEVKYSPPAMPAAGRRVRAGKAFAAKIKSDPKAKALPNGAGGRDDDDTPTHSPDFTSVNWFGTRYTFSKGNQSQAVRVLWEAWEKGEHSLSQETIGELIESSADRFEMRKTFRRRKPKGDGNAQHPAWGSMIQHEGKGSFRLVRPKSD